MKIQHKLVAIPLAVMLLVSACTILFIEQNLRANLLERNTAELTTLAVASLESVKTVEHIDEHGREHVIRSFQRLAENFAHAGDFRVTYIDANGQVLSDYPRKPFIFTSASQTLANTGISMTLKLPL